MCKRIGFLSCVICLIIYSSVGFAGDLAYKPGDLIVRFKPKANGDERAIAERNAVLASIGGGTIKHCYTLVPGLTLVKTAATSDC